MRRLRNISSLIDFGLVFAENWLHPGDQVAYWRHKSVKCAEALVPHMAPPKLIEGAYVASGAAAGTLQAQGFVHEVRIDPHLFFL